MLGREVAVLLLLWAIAGCSPSQAVITPLQAPSEEATEPDPASDTAEAALDLSDSPVLINELMASNDSTWMDERLDRDDWVELLNRDEAPVDLSGWGLSRDEDEGPSWTFPEGTVLEPGEHRLVWLDDEPEEGALHASFTVDEDGDTLALWEGQTLQDAVSWEDLGSDRVLGRFPDASPNLRRSVRASPLNANPADPGLSQDPSDAIFDPERVLTVDLWLDEESWAGLEREPYVYVEAGLGVEGVWLDPVGVRIKGQWGSLRTMDEKVALKLNLDAYVDKQRLRGLEHLTLNNMVQDPSAIHEQLAYTLFRDAGVPSPRTGHVALYLNGEYRGLYTNIETADDTFLARWYDSAEGNLYEGAYGQDLSAGSYTSLELDQAGAEDGTPFSELAPLAALLSEAPDESRVDELERLVDVDEVLRMWAVEILIGHWDGYFYYPNNYRVYHDPSTGLISLLPWGTDQTFSWTGELDDSAGVLATWCLKIPSLKRRFDLAIWDAADRMRALPLQEDATAAWTLVEPWLDADPYKESSTETGAYYYELSLDFINTWPDEVVSQLFPDGEPGVE